MRSGCPSELLLLLILPLLMAKTFGTLLSSFNKAMVSGLPLTGLELFLCLLNCRPFGNELFVPVSSDTLINPPPGSSAFIDVWAPGFLHVLSPLGTGIGPLILVGFTIALLLVGRLGFPIQEHVLMAGINFLSFPFFLLSQTVPGTCYLFLFTTLW